MCLRVTYLKGHEFDSRKLITSLFAVKIRLFPVYTMQSKTKLFKSHWLLLSGAGTYVCYMYVYVCVCMYVVCCNLEKICSLLAECAYVFR